MMPAMPAMEERRTREEPFMSGREILCAFGLVALVAICALAVEPVEPRIALVIGNGAYETGPLRNPLHDAEDMAAALHNLGFSVTLLGDADLRAMIEAGTCWPCWNVFLDWLDASCSGSGSRRRSVTPKP